MLEKITQIWYNNKIGASYLWFKALNFCVFFFVSISLIQFFALGGTRPLFTG